MADDAKSDIPDWVTTPPGLTLVSDSALRSGNPGADTFDLARQIGPLFEILRHPGTETPFAAAIYGDWGTGKTSAMRWLEGRLNQWNEAAKPRLKQGEDIRIVRTAWFYPWKYQEREEVWRGLVAEVILACLADKHYTLKSFTRDAKDLGRFMGRSVISILSGVKVSGGGVEAQAAALRDIARDFADTVTPEVAYLNEFETVMRNWVKRSLKDTERLVVFIDDLDRCMPDIALQVLEALKLYLNIEQLAFVIGVDKTVVDQLVVKRYDEMGVEEAKALDYLAKMFQVEIPLAPTETEVEAFFADIVAKNESWRSIEHRQDSLEPVIINLARRSPREVKRLINSALIHASGVQYSKLIAARGVEPPSPAQGVQNFLVRRILGSRYTMETHAGSKAGIAFFRAWSAAVADDPNAPPVLTLTDREIEILGRARGDGATRAEPTEGQREEGAQSDHSRVLDRIPKHFREIASTAAFQRFLPLLRDEDLGRLMIIPYPVEAGVFGDTRSADTPRVIREAIARTLGKDVDAVSPEDYRTATEIDLSNSDIVDIAPLSGLTGLQELYLQDTPVQDLTPLAGLTGLKGLNLDSTQVQDLSPLAELTGLQRLELAATPLQDLAPLAGLASLQSLNLIGTEVQDLAPLAGLTDLQGLYLSATPAQDLAPLAGLTSLERLSLMYTLVQDLSPLAGLTSLVSLDLESTQVQDLSPLAGLTGLESLDLTGCPVSREDVAELEKALPKARIVFG